MAIGWTPECVIKGSNLTTSIVCKTIYDSNLDSWPITRSSFSAVDVMGY